MPLTHRDLKAIPGFQPSICKPRHLQCLLAIDLDKRRDVLAGDSERIGHEPFHLGRSSASFEEAVADARADRAGAWDHDGIELPIGRICIGAWVEPAAVGAEVGDDENSSVPSRGVRAGNAGLDCKPGWSRREHLAENGLDVRSIPPLARSGFFKSVDHRGVDAHRDHDEEGQPVAGGQINTDRVDLGFEMLDHLRYRSGHPECFADQIRGAGAEVVHRGLGVRECIEEVMDGSVASKDDDPVCISNL